MDLTLNSVHHSNESTNGSLNCTKPSTHLLKEYIQYIQEENAKMDSILMDLGLLGNFPDIEKSLEKLKFVQINSDAKKCNVESIGLALAEKQRNQTNYIAKLKMCINVYIKMNDKLSQEIDLAKSQLLMSRERISSFHTPSEDEIKLLELKIKKYDNELLKFENKYPWLKDPQLHIINIMKEINIHNNLLEEKNNLLEELNAYIGLPPDLREARLHLKEVKLKYEQLKCSI